MSPEAVQSLDFAPPECVVCTRSLLVGEDVRLFRGADERVHQVCELCGSRAAREGFESVGYDVVRRRVHATGAVRDVTPAELHPEDPCERVAGDLDHNERDDATVANLLNQLQARDRELAELRRQLDSGRIQNLERTVREQQREIDKADKQQAVLRAQIERLDYARKAETDSSRMGAHALDAFNACEHAERMLRITRTLGEPEVSVIDAGPGIPRRVHLILAWDIAWYEFCIKVDLGRSKASVHEVDHGGDPRAIDADRRLGNGRWQSSGVVLV